MLPSRPSVLIVAHGSSVSESAQESAKQHALTLQQSNRYGWVDVCYLARQNTTPFLPEGEVFLLPFFMSGGYFVSRRIPELFGLQEGKKIEAERRLYLCDALGIDPDLAEVVANMARDVCRDRGYNPEGVHLVLVAHGSGKSSASAEATYIQRDAVKKRREFANVSVAFLSETPSLESWLLDQPEEGPPLVLVGLFAANGPHAMEDVPGALSVWQENTGGRRLAHYAGAVGPRPEIAKLIQRSISRRAAKGD